MKVETWVFGAGVLFFTPVAIIYGVVTQWGEPVGATALFLTAGLAALVSFYLFITSRRIDPRPEDDLVGEIADGAGELGHFSPYSWWPLAVAAGTSLVFAGLAVGWWMVLLGAPIAALSTVGWVYEYYRGEHAH